MDQPFPAFLDLLVAAGVVEMLDIDVLEDNGIVFDWVPGLMIPDWVMEILGPEFARDIIEDDPVGLGGEVWDDLVGQGEDEDVEVILGWMRIQWFLRFFNNIVIFG